MTTRALLLIIAAATCIAAFAGGGENALRNAAFVPDGDGVIPGWRVEALRHEVVRGAGPAGEDVLRLPLRGSRAYVVQTGLALREGARTVFGAFVRTRALPKNGARLILFSDEWKLERIVYLPSDTAGEWRPVEWRGALMPGGPYGFAIHAELRTEDGMLEVASPYVREASPSSPAQPGAALPRCGGKLVFHFDFNSLQHGRTAIVEMLEHVAAAGYDAVLWEIENAVRWECCPEVASPDAFTKDEFREILRAAKSLGLEPIPLMQTFGHGEYVLRHDRYRGMREVAERYDCYCPSKPETRAFLKQLLHEYLDLFGPEVKRFHLGGDEAWFYQTCAKCQARDALELYVEHLSDVGEELRARGIRPGCWHDMVLKFSGETGCGLGPFRDYTVWFWDYAYPKSWHPWGQADEPLRKMCEAGCEVVVCGSAQSWREDPFLVRYDAHRENLAACAELVRREGLAGLCVTSWTIHQGLKRLQYPLFDFAAKRYRNPGPDVAEEWRLAVVRAFGPVPPDALDGLSGWEVRYGRADGRGWAGYKDGTVPPHGMLEWAFPEGKADMLGLANEFDGVCGRTEAALGRIRQVDGLTRLGRLLVEAGELKLAYHRIMARKLRGEAVGDIPFERTRRHYAIEYAPEAAERAAKILYSYYAEGR